MEIKELKQEALERMKILKIHENLIKSFATENKLYKSEGLGSIYELSYMEKQMIKKYEKVWDILVYHVIRTTLDGEKYTLLFVSKNKDEWKSEKEDLKEGKVLSQRLVSDYVPDGETNYINVWSNRGAMMIDN